MSRPSKYSKEMLDKARAYVHNYESYEHAFPSRVGLADVLDVCAKTLDNWEADETKTEFAEILEKIARKQQLVAWHKGLTGQYNSNLVKLLLAKHGYHDKSEIEQKTTLQINQMSDDELAQIVNNES